MNFGKKESLTIKGVAILLLLFYHLFSQTYVYANFNVEFLLTRNQVLSLSSFGNICVAIFLLISAYGITVSQTQTKNIAKQSLLRVLVLIFHFLVMYLSIWVIWFSKLHYTWVYGEGKQSIIFALTDAFGLAEIFDTPTICMTWWYMEIAIICIVLVPVFQAIYQKISVLMLILILLVPCVVSMDMDVYKYIFVIALGVCAANGNWINRIKEMKIHGVVKLGFAILLMIFMFFLRSNAIVDDYYAFFIEGIVAFVWVVGLYLIFGNVFVITKILQFLGKHSMNIFFFHTFIYLILYRDQIYALKYAGIIYIVVLGISLLYSICIEFIKKKAGFYLLVKKIKGDNNG
jgi:hypothetical protein